MTHGSRSARTAGPLAAALALALACEQPPALPTQDRRSQVKTSHIEGQVVVTGPARGNVIITRFDAARPPPPLGTGRPLSFTIIPEREIFREGDTSSGPFTAPYAFSQVTPGRYILGGFLDARGAFCPGGACRASDFIPWYGVTGEPNAGDVRGAALNLSTLQLRELEIAPQNEDGDLNALTDISFTVDSRSSASQVSVDRPVFRLNTATSDASFTLATAPLCPGSSTVRCKFLDLVSEQIHEGVVDQRAPAFVVRFVDDRNNATGAPGPDCVPDDANGDSRPDFWPKIVIRKLADQANPALLIDENDHDRDGVVDAQPPAGVTLKDYPHADGSLDGVPDVLVLAAGISPDSAVMSQLVDGSTGLPRVNCSNPAAPVWPVAVVNQLRVVVQSVALDVIDPTRPVVLQGPPPAGKYAVVVINPTGQTWRTPNELQPAVAGPAGLPQRATQELALQVQ
jgi:hypothetical protein